ncbi:MAG TPA: ABC transporter substrate-binding protein [Firmicutes bacterium]|nr:ABC transporter substrate-binding protein [Bacillota bacterium]
MKKKFVFLVVLLFVVALALMMACSSNKQPVNENNNQPNNGPGNANNEPAAPAGPSGTIYIATTDFSYESTDPIFYESLWGFAMYDALLTFDADGNFMGMVAEDWELSEDGNTWTFKIRRGIKFHNGDPLTAHDVKFSIDRFASEESTNPWSPYLRANLNYTEVLDDYTFCYHTNTPEPTLLVPFAWTRILPKKYFEEVGQEEFRKKPVGSGPWKFVEHVPETSLTLEANTEHWFQVPEFQYVVDQQVPEEMTRISMLRTGEADIATGISTDRLVELRDKEGFRTVKIGDPVLWSISFPGTWVTNKPTGDIRVRQAMSLAINRQEICDTFYQGLAVPGGRWYMHPGSYGWDPSWQADPYDPDKAKQLLEEAGYPHAFADPTIKYYVTEGPGVDQAQLLQGYWADVGIDVQLEIVDSVQWGGMFFVRNTEPDAPNVGNIFSWSFSSTPNSVYHSANMYTSNGVHSTGNDAKADELYFRATTERDFDKARQYWTEFREYVETLYYNVGIVMIEPNVLISDKLGEFTTFTNLFLYDTLAGIKHPR